ncbi:MAG: mechanosensitive ion channel family protein, partial [Methanomicrobiales archaeon]|nr:mechanosensitive ion channel family protein [Methanomicrobiales archaeon]
VDNLGTSSVNLIIRAWTPSGEWYKTKRELLWKVKEALDNAGIEIPYPQQVVWFGQEGISKEGAIQRTKERQ